MSDRRDRTCEECGKPFRMTSCNVGNPKRGRFCTHSCRAKWQFRVGRCALPRDLIGEGHPLYRNGSRSKAGPPRGLPEANIILNNAVHEGRIEKGPCTRCGAGDAEAHHEDYSKPLEVVWLCRPCHRIRDRELREQLGVRRLSPIPAIRAKRGFKRAMAVSVIKELKATNTDPSPPTIQRLLGLRGIKVHLVTVRNALRSIA